MKKNILVALVLVSFFILSAQTLSYSGAEGWSPLFVKGDDGQVQGVAVEIMEELGKRLNTQVDFRSGLPWKRILNYVETGKLDALAGIYYTDERAEKFVYTWPFMINHARIFVLKDKTFKLNELHDLLGKEGGIPSGGSFGQKFDDFADANLEIYEAPEKNTLFKMLENDRFDFVVMDQDDGMAYLKANGMDDKITYLDFDVNTVNVHIIFSKSSFWAKDKEKIDNLIQEMHNDGFIKKVISKYK